MAIIDVFNGDADGLCALQQLRLARPVESRLVTGVKRDIALLDRVEAGEGDEVWVLDISLERNRPSLRRLLKAGARVHYFDHHYPGEIPEDAGLEAHIETVPDQGTSLLVDAWLGGRYRLWALVGTFGDNFERRARALAGDLGLSKEAVERLRELGTYLNYNAYGASVEDLHISPEQLFRRIAPYADPLEFVCLDGTFHQLESGYQEDMAKAASVKPWRETPTHAIVLLPAEPWARRVSGVLANRLAQAAPGRGHALLTALPEGGYVVSVRAPLEHPEGADTLCRSFGGGGRKAAGGIDHLSGADLEAFREAFEQAFRG